MSDHERPYVIPHTHEPTSKSAHDIVRKAFERDEPVFVVRAKDFFSVQVVSRYLELLEQFGPTNLDLQEDVVNVLNAFKAWQAAHMSDVRYPD